MSTRAHTTQCVVYVIVVMRNISTQEDKMAKDKEEKWEEDARKVRS